MSDSSQQPSALSEQLKRSIMHRHLEQLQGLELATLPELRSPFGKGGGGGGYTDIQQWTQDRMEQILQAKENCESSRGLDWLVV
jgi:hypothetical protein